MGNPLWLGFAYLLIGTFVVVITRGDIRCKEIILVHYVVMMFVGIVNSVSSFFVY